MTPGGSGPRPSFFIFFLPAERPLRAGSFDVKQTLWAAADFARPARMAGNDFDIYQTESGYTAVTNEVRRAILNALAKKDRQLPELVKITKKAKPTLSSVHMKELLAQRLVEEIPHPTDKRKKIYRLRARRIGSSNLPVDQLRSAVKQYVAISPLAARLPLTVTFDALCAAPPATPADALRQQARRLGALSAPLFPQATPRDLVGALAGFLEREGLARPLRLDLEALSLDLEFGEGLPADAPAERLAMLLAAFVQGVVEERAQKDGGAVAYATAEGRRFSLRLAPPA